MTQTQKLEPIHAPSLPCEAGKTGYPPPFAALVRGRAKRKLGDLFGLKNFGVNLTELAPGSVSAIKHCHSKQDEFIYVLEGTPILVFGEQSYHLKQGDCFGFAAGTGLGHQLRNDSKAPVVYLEIGDRSAGDEVEYTDADLRADFQNGRWVFSHKDGSPYE